MESIVDVNFYLITLGYGNSDIFGQFFSIAGSGVRARDFNPLVKYDEHVDDSTMS